MNNFKLIAVAVLMLGWTGVAEAGAPLYTPPMLTDDNVTYARCIVTNISDQDITVRVEVLNAVGTVTADTGEVTLAPGASNLNLFGFSGVDTCRFTVPSKKKVRAQGCISRMAMATCDTQFDAY